MEKGGGGPRPGAGSGCPAPLGSRSARSQLTNFVVFFVCFLFFFWEGVFFVFLFFKKNRSQNKTELQNPKVAAFTLFIKT